jgi:hypothetical protein
MVEQLNIIDYKIGVRINPGTGDGAFKAISTG